MLVFLFVSTDHRHHFHYDRRWNCFVSLIYLCIFLQLKEYSQKAVEILRAQNHILTNHPNSNIYKYVDRYWNRNIQSYNSENATIGHHLHKITCVFFLQHTLWISGVWWLLSGKWPLLGVQQSRSSLLREWNTPSHNRHILLKSAQAVKLIKKFFTY